MCRRVFVAGTAFIGAGKDHLLRCHQLREREIGGNRGRVKIALLASDRAIVLGPDIDTWLRTLAPARADSAPADGERDGAPTGLRVRDLSKI